jgi:hypothetical protein
MVEMEAAVVDGGYNLPYEAIPFSYNIIYYGSPFYQ